MDFDDESVRRSKSDVLCNVCGITGAQVHYGGICCVSCKMFFRRNSHFDLNNNQCVFNEKCDITVNSRRACRYCRLQKCFEIGMQRELLRASHSRPDRTREKTPSPTTTTTAAAATTMMTTNDLISYGRSLLNEEQWCRLSNVINVYNSRSPVSHIKNLLTDQSKHPMKLRLKMAKTSILEIIFSMYKSIQPFVETIPEFQSMQIHDRCELIERNLSCIGGFNAIIVFRDAGVTLSTAFKNGFPSIYGSNIVDDSVDIAHRTDNDVTLIKLLLPIILFSTSFNVILPNNTSNSYHSIKNDTDSVFCNTKRLFDIQNIYLEMMFKYMIYRFGYYEASLRFAALVKSFLDQSICVSRAEAIQAHDQLLQKIVKETEQALTLQDEPMEVNVM